MRISVAPNAESTQENSTQLLILPSASATPFLNARAAPSLRFDRHPNPLPSAATVHLAGALLVRLLDASTTSESLATRASPRMGRGRLRPVPRQMRGERPVQRNLSRERRRRP